MRTVLGEAGLWGSTRVRVLHHGERHEATPTAAPTQDWPGTPPSRSWSMCPACDPFRTLRKGIGQGSVTPLDRRGNQGPKVAGLSQKARGKNLVHSLPFGEHCALAPARRITFPFTCAEGVSRGAET